MERRTLVKALSVSGFVALGSGSVMRQLLNSAPAQQAAQSPVVLPKSFGVGAAQGQWAGAQLAHGMEDMGMPGSASQQAAGSAGRMSAGEHQLAQQDAAIKDHMPTQDMSPADKVRYFESVFDDDFFISDAKLALLRETQRRLDRLQRLVGHGNFNLLSMDQAFRYARNYSQVGDFTVQEKSLFEELFEADARRYGFYGNKVVDSLTATIPLKEVEKIPGTGHFLYRDKSIDFYNQLRNQVGDTLVLTSGVRSVVKQMHLFFAKADQSAGNLSKASRSLAPPGYSYHAVSDFDVGKVGFGYRNFTADFAETDEYKRIQDLGFVKIRYTADNHLGVRYEPWHIQVT